MSIWQDLPRPFFVLAPMDDVTDTIFRRVIAGCAPPDLYFTEFVNVDGLQSPGRQQLLKKLRFTPAERPIIAQIWGKDPENYYKTAKELVAMGFDGVDINMGCPVKAIVKNGCCAALIDNWDLASDIIDATKDGLAGRLPLSIKTRVGLNKVNEGWASHLLSKKLDTLTIHGRTAKQMSSVPANWDLIAAVRRKRDSLGVRTKIIGNGDVMNRSEGLKLAKRYKLDGIMIGRGIFQDPFAFAAESPWTSYTKEQRMELYRQHIEIFNTTWQKGERNIRTLNKFCKIYINGFDGAKELREQFMKAKTVKELVKILTA